MFAWNPFLTTGTAQDYARGRPDYHPSAVAAVARLLDLQERVDVAIDVGCGTGMSSRALTAVADLVLGVDVSQPMLAAATAQAGVHHARAAAERLPVRDDVAGLVVTAAAFHWFDQGAMLTDTARVLRPGGGFACYTDFHGGALPAAPEVARWLRESYRPRFPAPPRHGHDNAQAVAAAGLEFAGSAELAHEIPMTAAMLTDYLLSQSNATAAIDAGRATRTELRAHLHSELAGRMPSGPVPVPFTGRVWCARLPGGAGATPAPPRPAPAGTP